MVKRRLTLWNFGTSDELFFFRRNEVIYYICQLLQQNAKKILSCMLAKNSKVSLKTIQTASARLRVFTSMFFRCNFLKQFEPPLNAMTHWIDPTIGPRDQINEMICWDDIWLEVIVLNVKSYKLKTNCSLLSPSSALETTCQSLHPAQQNCLQVQLRLRKTIYRYTQLE